MDYGKSSEMYLKEIFLLSERGTKIRLTDVANVMQVSKASVNYAVKKLCKKGLLSHKLYGNIEITRKGIIKACKICKRQDIIADYFVLALGINPKSADEEACRLQYVASDAVVEKMMEAMNEKEQER